MNRREFEQAYFAHSDQIFRFFFYRVSDRALAEDLTNEVFTRAWEKRDSFTGGSAQAWFYRIARNLTIDHWRKKRETLFDEPPVKIDEDQPDLLERVAQGQSHHKLRQALGTLPDRLQQVVILRFVEELSAKDAAKIIGTTEGNLRVLQHRALGQLKKKLSHEDH